MEERKLCEWKDGKFEACKAAYEHYIDLGKPYDPYWNNKIQRGYKVNFCPFCGSEISKPSGGDWKILDVNCLPSDCFVKGRYIFSTKLRDNPNNDFWEIEDITTAKNMLEGMYQNRATYIYRDNITTKKSHEELAEEYYDLCDPIPENKKQRVMNAFIAGRKSMESE